MDVTLIAEQLGARVPGGTGRYTEELACGLAAAVPVRGIVGRDGPWTDRVKSAGVTIDSLNLPGPVLARLWERGLPPRVGAGDIAHAPTLLVPPVKAPLPLVVTIHDVVPWTHPETLTTRGVRFHRTMASRAAAGAAAIITPTEAVAEQVRRLVRPRGAVRAIPLGLTPLPVPEDADDRRQALGLGPHPYALFVGTTEPRKGLDVLLRAMSDPELKDLHLVIVGATGWGRVDLPTLAEDLGISARLHVVGRVDDPDLAALYAAARVLVMPSRAEGFGIPVIEGMAHGTPVVTSDDPALVETGAGHTLVAPVGDPIGLADALATAVAGGEDVRRNVAAGRAHALSLTWASAVAGTLEVYSDVLARASSAR